MVQALHLGHGMHRGRVVRKGHQHPITQILDDLAPTRRAQLANPLRATRQGLGSFGIAQRFIQTGAASEIGKGNGGIGHG
jgi:hypothetical protein